MKPSMAEALKFSFFTQSRDTRPPKRSRENEIWHAARRPDTMTNDARRLGAGDLRSTSGGRLSTLGRNDGEAKPISGGYLPESC